MLRNAADLSYDIPTNIKAEQLSEINKLKSEDGGFSLINYLRENEIGKKQSFRGPFGGRRIGFCFLLFVLHSSVFAFYLYFSFVDYQTKF